MLQGGWGQISTYTTYVIARVQRSLYVFPQARRGTHAELFTCTNRPEARHPFSNVRPPAS